MMCDVLSLLVTSSLCAQQDLNNFQQGIIQQTMTESLDNYQSLNMGQVVLLYQNSVLI